MSKIGNIAFSALLDFDIKIPIGIPTAIQTNVATQIDSPKVYYKIKPEIGYVICGYCNICFVLKENADLDTDRVYFYDERMSKLEAKSNSEERRI